ncbi:MAG: hypothetical protein C0596_18905 [Marinilabiliales bacterium]|nr:MAG: hypothetical protein C0596_18905 [Marinilabiliales bacterium]
MKKTFTIFTLILLTLLSATAFGQLQEHIDQAKKDYLKYADTEHNAQIKAYKEVTSYNVGDSRNFWRYNLSVMPPGWINQSATCRAVGEKSYIFVADDDWGTNMTQQDVDSVFKYLENATATSEEMGIMEMSELYFGTIPDELDSDPKVIFYFSSLGSYNGSVFDGYFSAYNQMTEAEAQDAGSHSNECEMLYMSCNPVDPTDMVTLSVLSHELQHLIHFGYDPNEETWIDEGCAEFAMVLFGEPDPITSFTSNSDNNLTAWDQNFSYYVKTMLFVTYLAEHTIGPDFITALVANTENGINGIESTLESISFPLSFQEIFTNWTIANYVDDLSYDEGIYAYELLSLPAFTVKQYFTSYPASKSGSVSDCAAHYYKFNTYFTTLELNLNFPEGGDWQMHLLAYEDDNIKDVIPFDGNSLSFDQPDSYVLSKLVMVLTNSTIGSSDKEFELSINDVNSVNDISFSSDIKLFPNPTSDYININIENSQNVIYSYEILNPLGQTILSGDFENETKINLETLKKGTYFIKISDGEKSSYQKILKN